MFFLAAAHADGNAIRSPWGDIEDVHETGAFRC